MVALILTHIVTLSPAFALAPKARLVEKSIKAKYGIVGKSEAIQSDEEEIKRILDQWQFLDSPNITELGNRVMRLRRSKKKTQKELADELGWSRQWINMGEQSKWNNPRAETLLELVNYFRVTLFYLITGRESSQPFSRLELEAIRPNLARLINVSGIRADELENEIDVNPGWVSKVVAGQLHPSLTTLMRLARFFREPIDDFFVEQDEVPLDRSKQFNPIEDELLAFSLSNYEQIVILSSCQALLLAWSSSQEQRMRGAGCAHG